jgi:hypothetical protein
MTWWEDPSEREWEPVELAGSGSISILRTRDELDQDELQELAELEARRVPIGFAPPTRRRRTRKAKP